MQQDGKQPEWEQLEEWFHRYDAAGPEEREALLDRLLQLDPAMHAELVELQQGDPTDGGPAANTSEGPGPGVELGLGSRLGSYCITQELGSGGMGTVYRAERADGQYEQTVAIKVIKDPELRQDLRERFQREQQTLARLDDPRIVRLLDGGVTEAGIEYFVMEFVEGGIPIDRFCDEHRLTIPQRLRLFEQTARAVHAAHRRFVVHRDLKPGNILIDHDGGPKLLDFGIAKSLRAGQLGPSITATGQHPRTPESASPEQVLGGPITPASDVYALGLILHRLLCGRSPYETQASTLHALEKAICEQEPLRPSESVRGPDAARIAAARSSDPRRLRRRLRGALDTVVMKALAKNHEERYPSAEQLADDVLRVLEDRPILATAPSWPARLRRHWLRQRVRIAVAAGLVLALAGYWWRTDELRQQAKARATEVAQRDRALADTQRLMTRALRLRTPWSEEQPEPELVDRIVAILDSDQPLDPGGRIELLLALCLQLRAFHRLPESGEQLRRAEELAQGLDLPEVLRFRLHLEAVDHAFACGRLDEALERSEALVQRQLERPATPRLLAHALRQRARSTRIAGHFEPARHDLEQALALLQRTPRPGGSPPQDMVLLLVLCDRALVSIEQGQPRRAEAQLRDCLQTGTEMLGPRHPYVLNARCNLASTLHDLGRLEEAFVELDRAEEGWRAAVGDSHPQLAHVASIRGRLLEDAGRPGEAGPVLQRAHDLLLRHRGERHPDTLMSANNLANWHYRDGNTPRAEAMLRRALFLAQDSLEAGHPHTARLSGNLGTLLSQTDRPEEAQPLLEQAVRLRVQRLGASHPDTLAARERLAENLALRNAGAEAIQQRQEIVEAMTLAGQGAGDAFTAALAEQLYLLAFQQSQLNRHREAGQNLERAANLLDTMTPPAVPAYTRALILWARCEARRGEYERSTEVLERLLDTLDTAEGEHTAERALLERCFVQIDEWRDRGGG